MALSFQEQVDQLNAEWKNDPRWQGVQRDYTAEDVVRLRIDSCDDATDNIWVVEKVLPEPLSRPVIHHEVAPRTRCPARSSAANKLCGSALLVAARSSAVPWSTEVRMIGNPSVTLTASPNPRALRTGSPWS